MNRSTRQKLHKETTAVTHIVEQMNLIDMYKTFCPTNAEYAFFIHQYMKLSPVLILDGPQKKTLQISKN